MTSYSVQYIMPVDNPVMKVSISRSKQHMTFEVPINHPDAHKMSLMDLIAAAELSGLVHLSQGLKNRRVDFKTSSSKVES